MSPSVFVMVGDCPMMKDAAVPGYNLVAGMFWTIFVPGIGAALYMTKAKKPILDDLCQHGGCW